jgi:hypothetical protein
VGNGSAMARIQRAACVNPCRSATFIATPSSRVGSDMGSDHPARFDNLTEVSVFYCSVHGGPLPLIAFPARKAINVSGCVNKTSIPTISRFVVLPTRRDAFPSH